MRVSCMLLAVLTATPFAVSQDLAPRTPFAKNDVRAIPHPDPDWLREAGLPEHRLCVKFVDGARVRAGSDGTLTSRAAADLDDVSRLASSLELRFSPLIQLPGDRLAALESRAALRSGRNAADLAGLHRVEVPDATATRLEEVGEALQSLAIVECAWIQTLFPPPPGDIAPPTPDHTSDQTYRGPDPGMDADYGECFGASGTGVNLADCEYGWNPDHEDLNDIPLNLEPGQTIAPGVFANDWHEHGTAVLGQTSAVVNAYGCTGMVPDATVSTWPEWTVEEGFRRVTCITNAIASSSAGDVVLLEMQNGSGAPAEIDLGVWTVTRTGVDAGVIVVGAAGNGSQNLDSPAYASYRSRGDSGAIIVGAGSANTSHTRLSFSTYGSRVNVQGWGTAVFTLGYGSFIKYGGDDNQAYTSSFGGTSSASPFVASAAVALQDVAMTHLGGPLDPDDVRQILIDTGIPQGGGNPIGPFVDLKAAIAALFDLVLVNCPREPALGDAVTWTTGNGQPGNGAVLFLLDAAGVPFVRKVARGVFDVDGEYEYANNLPNDPVLSGVTLRFFSVGRSAVTGGNAVSNVATMDVQ